MKPGLRAGESMGIMSHLVSDGVVDYVLRDAWILKHSGNCDIGIFSVAVHSN